MARGGRLIRRPTARCSEGRKVQDSVRAPTSRQKGGTQQATQAPQHAALPNEADVLRAVASLYKDELRPYSRILRKRIAEQSGSRGTGAKDCDAGRLRALCESFKSLRVEPEAGGEWSALLVDRPPCFVDIYSDIDIYPEEVWTAAEAYFRSLGETDEYALPGGRYASAQALVARRLPFLAGYTVGQVCHFTQIAVSRRKLLGYADGAIVPYSCSTSMAKSRCAQQQKPHLASAVATTCASQDEPLAVADWSIARTKLQEILRSSARQGSAQVPLSNVKRLFRSQYRMELSETALGHTKLTDLLQDARFSDICEVRLQDRGYVVVPAPHFAAGANVAHPILGNPPRERRALDVKPGPEAARRQEPLRHFRDTKPPVQRTFIHYRLPSPAGPSPSAGRRSRSLPSREMLQTPRALGGLPKHSQSDSCLPEGEPDPDVVPAPFLTASTKLRTPRNTDCGIRVAETDSQLSAGHHRAESHITPDCDPCINACKTQAQPECREAPSTRDGRVQFCPDEPLVIDEEEELPSARTVAARPFALMTPSPQYGGASPWPWLSLLHARANNQPTPPQQQSSMFSTQDVGLRKPPLPSEPSLTASTAAKTVAGPASGEDGLCKPTQTIPGHVWAPSSQHSCARAVRGAHGFSSVELCFTLACAM